MSWREDVAKLRFEAGELIDQANKLRAECRDIRERMGDWAPELDKRAQQIKTLTVSAHQKLRFATGIEEIELRQEAGVPTPVAQ